MFVTKQKMDYPLSQNWSSMSFPPIIFQGSFKCSPCKPGFIGDGYLGCYAGDLCTSSQHTCQVNAQCASTGDGKYKCTVWILFDVWLLNITNQLANGVFQLIEKKADVGHYYLTFG